MGRRPESRGEGWHQFLYPNTSNDQVSISYLGVPAPAGMSDWYESMSRTTIRDVPCQSTSMPALHRRNVPNCRPVADGGMRKCSAGACPPQGSGWGVGRIRRANSACTQGHNSGFSYPVCPHPAGIQSDWDEKPLPLPLGENGGEGEFLQRWPACHQPRRPNRRRPSRPVEREMQRWGLSPAKGARATMTGKLSVKEVRRGVASDASLVACQYKSTRRLGV